MLFDRGRRRMALERLDIRRNRDRFNVFEVLITGSTRLRIERPLPERVSLRVTILVSKTDASDSLT